MTSEQKFQIHFNTQVQSISNSEYSIYSKCLFALKINTSSLPLNMKTERHVLVNKLSLLLFS